MYMNTDVETIIRDHIDKTLHMSLATASNNHPWVTELHFVYDDSLNLYWRSLASRRHSIEIAANPNVAGNIVKQHSLDEYPHAIYFEGRAELLTGIGEQQRIFPLFQQRLGAGEDILTEALTEDGHKFFKITIQNWYAFGKFGADHGQKLELAWNGGARV